MRRRRVERCILRAQVALEAGFPDDAREALEEAQRLDPSTPPFADFERQAAAGRVREYVEDVTPDAAREEASPRRPLRYSVLLAAVIVIALVGAVAFQAGRGPAAVRQQAVTPPNAVVPRAPAPTVTPLVSSIVIPASEQKTEPVGTAGGEIEDRDEPARRTEAVPATPQVSEPTPPVAEPTPRTASPDPVSTVAPPPAPPAVVRAAEPIDLGAGLAPVTLPPAAEPPASAVAPPPAAPPVIDERARVRAVLSRYEAAYSGLNASAARQVWPGVDERALARAFDGLSAQSLSLGRCDMSIADATARADCSGTASWTPKVGGGSRTQNRRWQFELAKAGDDWKIVRATAR